MVKLARSPYRTAKRSPEWMKYKLNKQDEFVVCGWTDPGGTRVHFGSLILGAHATACATREKSAPASRARSSSAS